MGEYTEVFRGVEKINGLKVFIADVKAKVAGKTVKFEHCVPVSPLANKQKNRLQYLELNLRAMDQAFQSMPKAKAKGAKEVTAELNKVKKELTGAKKSNADLVAQVNQLGSDNTALLAEIDKLHTPVAAETAASPSE